MMPRMGNDRSDRRRSFFGSIFSRKSKKREVLEKDLPVETRRHQAATEIPKKASAYSEVAESEAVSSTGGTTRTSERTKICYRCQSFIVEYLTEERCTPSFFDFKHGDLSEVKRSSQEGCDVCTFALQICPEGHRWIRGSPEQATLLWGKTVELYLPGEYASHAKPSPLESNPALDYRPLDTDRKHVYILQRDMPARTDDPLCFDLIRKWMGRCVQSHPRCKRIDNCVLPTRVIDVGEPGRHPFLLQTNGGHGQYLALSHRWPRRLDFKTTRANFAQNCREMPLQSFPATFRDAVIVCRNVGIRYLWIDALCIIQNSHGGEDWDREAPKMASIYGHAVFTISALHASSSDDGLFCRRPRLPFATFPSPIKSSDAPRRMGIRLAYPSFDQEMEDSPLSSRGWIYQERALSQATLHYSAHQMIWECRNIILSEGAGGIELVTRAVTYDFGRTLSILNRSDFDEQMEEWESVVESFTRLRFTCPTDKVPAIHGVALRFRNEHVPSAAIAGLWVEAFHKHLLWVYDERDEPRMLGPSSKKKIWVERGWKPRSPSWSWISVDYPVQFLPSISPGDLSWNIRLPDSPNMVSDQNTKASFATLGDGDGFEVTLEGRLIRLKPSGSREGRHPGQTPVSCRFQTQLRGQSIDINALIDPGRSLRDSAQVYAVRVATNTGMGTVPVPPCSYFLLLEALDVSQNHFVRIGTGAMDPNLAMAIFSVPWKTIVLL